MPVWATVMLLLLSNQSSYRSNLPKLNPDPMSPATQSLRVREGVAVAMRESIFWIELVEGLVRARAVGLGLAAWVSEC